MINWAQLCRLRIKTFDTCTFYLHVHDGVFSTGSWFNLTTWMNWEIHTFIAYTQYTGNRILILPFNLCICDFTELIRRCHFSRWFIHSPFSSVDLSHLGVIIWSSATRTKNNSMRTFHFRGFSKPQSTQFTTWTSHIARCISCFSPCHKLERRFHYHVHLQAKHFTGYFSPEDFCNSCVCVRRWRWLCFL